MIVYTVASPRLISVSIPVISILMILIITLRCVSVGLLTVFISHPSALFYLHAVFVSFVASEKQCNDPTTWIDALL